MFLLILLSCGVLLNLYGTYRILQRLPRHHYSFGVTMAIGTLNPGGTGSFQAQFLDNGSPSSVAPSTVPVWTADDSSATFVTDSTGLNTVVTLPAADTVTSITITVTATAPDGTTATGSITVTVAAGANRFSFSITQVS